MENYYKKMYAKLCGAASEAVDLLTKPETMLQAKCILERALLEAEDMYLSQDETASYADDEQ